MRLVFDIETNGLLDEITKIHCLVIYVLDEEKYLSYTAKNIEEAVYLLSSADEIIGHNIIKFDLPAIKKLYPTFEPTGKIIDTLILSRLFWPALDETDGKLVRRGTLPKKLQGRYSLEAFGYRLGLRKGDYAKEMEAAGLDPWSQWSAKMQDYCQQDVAVTTALWHKCLQTWRGQDKAGKGIAHSDSSIFLEMEVAKIIARQEQHGFAFDVPKAEKFYIRLLSEREKLKKELQSIFGAWWVSEGQVYVAKTRRMKRKDLPPIGDKFVIANYIEGSTYEKIKRVEFNPASHQHIANRLIDLHGWKPTEYTPSGQVKVDETILAGLPFPEAKALTQYMLVSKRIAQLAEGKQAWLKQEKHGRIHGSVITVGAVTRRMTHNNPNVAQVPSVGSPFGEECRELFTASSGRVLVGCDADALELRCLAGYMANYDGGDYIKTVLSGDKAAGTDMHSVNCRALGLDPKGEYNIEGVMRRGRDIAKTFFYAFIYGAGDFKLGSVVGTTGTAAQITAAGKQARARFLTGLPALGRLVKAVQLKSFGGKIFKKDANGQVHRQVVAGRGFLIALDKGKIAVRYKHAALNTLLQSAGAILMKKALVILDDDCRQAGLRTPTDYEFCANVHDEWQIDCLPVHAKKIAELAESAIRKAGEAFHFPCPLAGQAAIGKNWKETH